MPPASSIAALDAKFQGELPSGNARTLYGRLLPEWLPSSWRKLGPAAWEDQAVPLEERAGKRLRHELASQQKRFTTFVVQHNAHRKAHVRNTVPKAAGDVNVSVVLDQTTLDRASTAGLDVVSAFVERPATPPPAKLVLGNWTAGLVLWVPLHTAGIASEHTVLINHAPYAAVMWGVKPSAGPDGSSLVWETKFWVAKSEDVLAEGEPIPGLDDDIDWPSLSPLKFAYEEPAMDPFIPGTPLQLLPYLDMLRLPEKWEKAEEAITDGRVGERDKLSCMARSHLYNQMTYMSYYVCCPSSIASEYKGPRIRVAPGKSWLLLFCNTGDKYKSKLGGYIDEQSAADKAVTNKTWAAVPEGMTLCPVYFEYPLVSLPRLRTGTVERMMPAWVPLRAWRYIATRTGHTSEKTPERDYGAMQTIHGEPYVRGGFTMMDSQGVPSPSWSYSWRPLDTQERSYGGEPPALVPLLGEEEGMARPTLAQWVVRSFEGVASGECACGQAGCAPCQERLHVQDGLAGVHERTADKPTVDIALIRSSIERCVRAVGSRLPLADNPLDCWVKVRRLLDEELLARAWVGVPMDPRCVAMGVMVPLLAVAVKAFLQGAGTCKTGPLLPLAQAGSLKVLQMLTKLCSSLETAYEIGHLVSTGLDLWPAFDRLTAMRGTAPGRKELALASVLSRVLLIWQPTVDSGCPGCADEFRTLVFTLHGTLVQAWKLLDGQGRDDGAEVPGAELAWLEEDGEAGGSKGKGGKRTKKKGKAGKGGADGAGSAAADGQAGNPVVSTGQQRSDSRSSSSIAPAKAQASDASRSQAQANATNHANDDDDEDEEDEPRDQGGAGDGHGPLQTTSAEGGPTDDWEVAGSRADRKLARAKAEPTGASVASVAGTAPAAGGRPVDVSPPAAPVSAAAPPGAIDARAKAGAAVAGSISQPGTVGSASTGSPAGGQASSVAVSSSSGPVAVQGTLPSAAWKAGGKAGPTTTTAAAVAPPRTPSQSTGAASSAGAAAGAGAGPGAMTASPTSPPTGIKLKWAEPKGQADKDKTTSGPGAVLGPGSVVERRGSGSSSVPAEAHGGARRSSTPSSLAASVVQGQPRPGTPSQARPQATSGPDASGRPQSTGPATVGTPVQVRAPPGLMSSQGVLSTPTGQPATPSGASLRSPGPALTAVMNAAANNEVPSLGQPMPLPIPAPIPVPAGDVGVDLPVPQALRFDGPGAGQAASGLGMHMSTSMGSSTLGNSMPFSMEDQSLALELGRLMQEVEAHRYSGGTMANNAGVATGTADGHGGSLHMGQGMGMTAGPFGIGMQMASLAGLGQAMGMAGGAGLGLLPSLTSALTLPGAGSSALAPSIGQLLAGQAGAATVQPSYARDDQQEDRDEDDDGDGYDDDHDDEEEDEDDEDEEAGATGHGTGVPSQAVPAGVGSPTRMPTSLGSYSFTSPGLLAQAASATAIQSPASQDAASVFEAVVLDALGEPHVTFDVLVLWVMAQATDGRLPLRYTSLLCGADPEGHKERLAAVLVRNVLAHRAKAGDELAGRLLAA